MRIIVTRPADQAAAWVARLQDLGADAAALPLIGIEPAEDPQPLRAAWRSLADYALVMFVSPNAVAHFFALRPAGCDWPAATLAGSVGPGSSAALREAGVGERVVEPAADARAFDSEALWLQLQDRDWAGRRVLVVRGEDGREWLAETLRGRGAFVEFVAAYRRRPPRPDEAGRALLDAALAFPHEHLWHFSSSEAVGHLRALAPGADWSRSRAVASHPRIAAAARALGFADVAELPPSVEVVAEWASRRPPIESASL
ncbi:uroporphyrinogen-III synthase [Rubrivivax benzoatilyticus]|uniref:Uroporphyrinogen-III synthase n=1 Tax=Rubrivivax benzoatilyticus TaxID=316997 RepID=A0ABX0I145_9BURK|nr:uroporphyrinogen-III synthase [Rubrivivax benzoatilyticus]EGJ12153.1 uroporphyrinogen III synthase [Rubrivivax benzoatilyticus JA2 = ATCC BAA-35]NHK99852.1 uroporphyrinogen-III synthase [Rubrivivax benzoatilyticus]NHL25725.1 uroporphyrinogen-III synthase [Rubrivivax benzoatilyticus]